MRGTPIIDRLASGPLASKFPMVALMLNRLKSILEGHRTKLIQGFLGNETTWYLFTYDQGGKVVRVERHKLH